MIRRTGRKPCKILGINISRGPWHDLAIIFIIFLPWSYYREKVVINERISNSQRQLRGSWIARPPQEACTLITWRGTWGIDNTTFIVPLCHKVGEGTKFPSILPKFAQSVVNPTNFITIYKKSKKYGNHIQTRLLPIMLYQLPQQEALNWSAGNVNIW
jgi:hypothetical protein